MTWLTWQRFRRYLLTGGLAAIVDALAFSALVALSLHPGRSAAISFVVSAIVNYSVSARYTFGSSHSVRSFILFFLLALVGLGVNVSVTVAGISLLDSPPLVAKLLGTGTAFALNFILNAGLVFNARRPARSASE